MSMGKSGVSMIAGENGLWLKWTVKVLVYLHVSEYIQERVEVSLI